MYWGTFPPLDQWQLSGSMLSSTTFHGILSRFFPRLGPLRKWTMVPTSPQNFMKWAARSLARNSGVLFKEFPGELVSEAPSVALVFEGFVVCREDVGACFISYVNKV